MWHSRGPKEARPRIRYLSHEEEEALLEAALPYLRDVIAVAIDTGSIPRPARSSGYRSFPGAHKSGHSCHAIFAALMSSIRRTDPVMAS